MSSIPVDSYLHLYALAQVLVLFINRASSTVLLAIKNTQKEGQSVPARKTFFPESLYVACLPAIQEVQCSEDYHEEHEAMANPEHVERLKRGVKVWNQWRKDHSEIRPDLSHADLSGADLSEANLAGANLTLQLHFLRGSPA